MRARCLRRFAARNSNEGSVSRSMVHSGKTTLHFFSTPKARCSSTRDRSSRQLPSGTFSDLAFRPSRRLNLDARIEHVLTKTHTARFQFQRNAGVQNNLGVGDFDLPARGYSQDQTEYIARFADSGVFGKKFFNEVRFQARWLTTEARSVSLGQTILVPGAFNDGSAQRRGGRRQLDFELADNVDYALEKHGVRFGVQLEAGGYRSDERTNAFGTFQFADLDAFEAGLPTQFTQRIGDPTVKYRQYQFGWYVQDDYRLRKNLTISYGVRHELQNHVPGKFNVAPRLGFVWSPKKNGAITLRGGAGIFYDWFAAQIYEQTLRVDGERQRDLVVTNPGFPNPFSGGMQTILAAQPDPNRSGSPDPLHHSGVSRCGDESIEVVSLDDKLPVSTRRAPAARPQSQRAGSGIWPARSDRRQHHEY